MPFSMLEKTVTMTPIQSVCVREPPAAPRTDAKFGRAREPEGVDVVRRGDQVTDGVDDDRGERRRRDPVEGGGEA